jgi:hypothetical protein
VTTFHVCIACVKFCHWLLGNQWLHTKIAFASEAMFNRGRMTNTHNSHVLSVSSLHASMKTHFQDHLSVNIWCYVIGSQVIGPFVLEEHLTSKHYLHFLEGKLPVLLEMFLSTTGKSSGCSKIVHSSFW